MEKVKLQSETERLTLRPLQKEDYERWLEGFSKRLPSQYKYDGEKMDLKDCTQEKFNNVVTEHRELADRDKIYVFGVFRKSDQKHIGMVELCTLLRREFQWGLLSYIIHNQFWKNGYGTEAVKEGIRMGFENLGYHRIEAHINVDNAPSIRLVERVGLTYECTRKGFIYEFDRWNDNHVYYMNSK